MKRLIYAATLTLTLTSLVGAAYADEVSREHPRATQIIHSGAHPNSQKTPNATYHFELHVGGNALSQLEIDLPDGIDVPKQIEVTDRSGERIDATVSIDNQKAAIAFARPISPGTILSVSLQGIEIPQSRGVWHYPIYGRFVGLTAPIPLGTVRIQTYG
ncbi:MAG: DUF2808 domain-containing protein [Cyanosarcina radialis HA8281-LM2]|jgi:hypothetical protein|nr:DUF2808 domain-containing protein [Cyanosarcina radialis HA8281-LM2]